MVCISPNNCDLYEFALLASVVAQINATRTELKFPLASCAYVKQRTVLNLLGATDWQVVSEWSLWFFPKNGNGWSTVGAAEDEHI